MRRWALLGVAVLAALPACSSDIQAPAGSPAPRASHARRLDAAGLIDRQATRETRALFENLRALSGRGLLIGHQQSTAEGVGWINQPNRSDIHSVAHTFPAVWGWDFSDIHSVSAGRLTGLEEQIRWAFARGGVNTLSWHMPNPATLRDHTDTTPVVHRILPGGDLHGRYRSWLDELAAFARSLRTPDGKSIPLVFRPFHEADGRAFWWGAASTTPEESIALWRFTADYLRHVKAVHNFLYAYSPGGSLQWPGAKLSRDEYFRRYPGDDYVDLLGVDFYDTSQKLWWMPFAGRQFSRSLVTMLRLIVEEANARGKLGALTETGQPDVETATWWTGRLLDPIKSDRVARQISYVLIWTNTERGEHFGPYPGHKSVPDFLKMRDDPFSLFLDDVPDLYANRGVVDRSEPRREREQPAGHVVD